MNARWVETLREVRRLLPQSEDYRDLRRTWMTDAVAGLTVGVVALPLALAFGIASGLGAEAGLVCAIVGGLVAAVFGGSNVQVSGPTGAMAVVLLPVVHRFGPDAVIHVGLIAGVLILAASVARLGRALAFVPWPVVEGFTVGIAAIIFLQQVPSALGVPRPEGENTILVAVRAVADAGRDGVLSAAGVVLVVAFLMVLLPRLHRAVPGSLVAVTVATLFAELARLDIGRIGAIPASLPQPVLPPLSLEQFSTLFPAAAAIAGLAALESLLSAKVADGMRGTGRHDPDRELLGQGLANVASSLFGGMPATGAIARTAVNVRAGGRTRAAAVVHSLLLMGVVYVGAPLVARIPLAALAGVLMVTAVRMVERHNVLAVFRATRSDAMVLVLTASATVLFDLILAVQVGMAVAAVLALRQVARSASASLAGEAFSADEVDGDEGELFAQGIVMYRLEGALFFGAAQRFLTALTEVADVRVIILRLPQLQVLDATGAQALGEIIAELEGRGITVLLKGPRAEHLRSLRAVGALNRLAHEQHVFATLGSAVAHARVHVTREAAPQG